MLVLTRKPGEKIVIPGMSITVEVLAVRGGTVRLGLTAPRQVAIHRAEIARTAAKLPPKG